MHFKFLGHESLVLNWIDQEDSEYADENNFVAKRFKKVNSPEQLAFLKDSAFSFVAGKNSEIILASNSI